jgi:hypothetical protein
LPNSTQNNKSNLATVINRTKIFFLFIRQKKTGKAAAAPAAAADKAGAKGGKGGKKGELIASNPTATFTQSTHQHHNYRFSNDPFPLSSL